jgi:hypothetical protein
MKPNDENGKLPVSERPFRVLIISGSDRRQYNLILPMPGPLLALSTGMDQPAT